jgi:hypothetical protein
MRRQYQVYADLDSQRKSIFIIICSHLLFYHHDDDHDDGDCQAHACGKCQAHACNGMECTESAPVPSKSRRLQPLHSPLRMASRRRCVVLSERREKESPLFSTAWQPCVVRSRFVSFPLLGLEVIMRVRSSKCAY